MSFGLAFQRLPVHLVEVLREAGALEPSVFVQLVDSREAAVDLLLGTGLEFDGNEGGLADDLVALAALAQAPARCARRAIVNATGLDITMAVLAAEGTGGSPSVPLVDRGQRLRGQKGLGAAPKWPAKVRRRELVGGAPTARQAAEQTERHKWLDAVVSIVMEARLPAAELLGGAARGDHLRGCVGQGRRVRTLKKRVTDWRKVRSFMLKAFGEPWPRTQLDFLDYLRARADEPCARTVPASCLAALAFMEKSGNIAVGDRISGEASVKAFVEEMNLSLSGHGSAARRVAPRWPLAVAIALELAVLDKGRPVYERLLSWWLLVKLWGDVEVRRSSWS